MTEINSDESLLSFLAKKGEKSQSCVKGLARKTRKCTAACVRTNKGDRCTGAADTPAVAATAESLYCSDAVQKTHRPPQKLDRGSVCIKNAADCRGQCSRAGKNVANDKPQCTGTRSHRAKEGQCTIAAVKCAANDNMKCTGTRSYKANESQCTVATVKCAASDNPQCICIRNYRTNESQCTVAAVKYAANDNPQCTGTRSYKSNEGQCTVAAVKYAANDNSQCTCTRNYRANESQCTVAAVKCAANDNLKCTGTRSYKANEGQYTAVSAVNYAASDNPQSTGALTLVTTVYKWARVAVDWTWDKRSYFLVSAVSFFLGIIYIYNWCLNIICEEES